MCRKFLKQIQRRPHTAVLRIRTSNNLIESNNSSLSFLSFLSVLSSYPLLIAQCAYLTCRNGHQLASLAAAVTCQRITTSSSSTRKHHKHSKHHERKLHDLCEHYSSEYHN